MKGLTKIFKDSKVIITGNTGFKGSWLTFWLKMLGADIYGISNEHTTNPSHFKVLNLGAQINNFTIDIRETNKTANLINEIKPDFIFHLAAQPIIRESYLNPIRTWETNTIGTLNILEGLRKLDTECIAILITSDKCYENVEWIYGYRETDKLGGIDPYSSSKAAAEIAISSYVRSFFKDNHPVRIGIGRAGNVVGGGDWAKDRIVPDCIRSWTQESSVKLRNPNSTRPWQHVLEPLSGYLTLAKKLKSKENLHGEAFNFGPPNEQSYTVNELVNTMAKCWDFSRYENLISLENEVYHESNLLKLNCDKSFSYLRWKSIWDFNETVTKTVDWYKTFYELDDKKEIEKTTARQIIEYHEKAIGENMPWTK